MARTAILAIRIISDARKAAKDLNGLSDGAGRVERGFKAAAPAARGTVLALGAVAVAAGKQASDLQQSSGAVESVFRNQAAQVKGLARGAANSAGLATSEYQQMAAVLGAQLTNLGVAQKDLVPTTDSLIKKGADLSAMFGGTTAEAVEALTAAFRGETDPIEKYGVSIKQAAVQAELAKRGQDKLTGAAATAAKTQATLDLITRQTASSTGQFARESDTAAGAQARATASLKNAGAELGTTLLPLVATAAAGLAEVAAYVQDNSTAFTILAGIVGGVALAVLAVNAAMKAYAAITAIVRAAVIVFRNAQLALNLAMMANPVGLVIAAIALLVAGIVLAYKKSETFRAIVQAVMRAAGAAVGWVVSAIGDLVGWVKDKAPAAWAVLRDKAVAAWRILTAPARVLVDKVRDVIGWVKDKAPAAFTFLKDKAVGAFNALIAPIKKVIGWVQDLINKISNIKMPDIGFGGSGFFSGGLFGGGGLLASSHSPGLTAAAGSTGTAGRRLSGNAPAVQIIVQGALDPDAVARQIETLLARRQRRLGRA